MNASCYRGAPGTGATGRTDAMMARSSPATSGCRAASASRLPISTSAGTTPGHSVRGAEEPAAPADQPRGVERVARDQELHALAGAQVGADHDALGGCRRRAAETPRADRPGNSDRAGRCGCGAAAPARPASP